MQVRDRTWLALSCCAGVCRNEPVHLPVLLCVFNMTFSNYQEQENFLRVLDENELFS